MLKILIYENITAIRAAVREALAEQDVGAQVDELADPAELSSLLTQKPEYDLIVLSESIEGVNVQKLIRRIRHYNPLSKILFFAGMMDYAKALGYFSIGISGYLTRRTDISELRQAVRSLVNGEMYICKELVDAIVREKFTGIIEQTRLLPVKHLRSELVFRNLALSDREQEIAKYLALGRSTSSIAKSLNLKLSTVSTHKSHIFRKLGVDNLVSLIYVMQNASS